ncbi:MULTISPECIES: hypothetical protein [Legionella]|uniref:Major Facilitator Superfamily protein n=1 Tax=Legionella drozanskii LLAP-1 TaxID=1212489 RepID=A0A0W0SMI0_9GAMM|nr:MULTISPECIES: hypothetical protein [Legionella]KTC84539.1 hypothetical protein Ldro_2703 [Legionella drozanskii LLAP-1]PJE09553.1 MAG: hypothetical protein CK430_10905 [Legionella sp.]
MIRYLKLMIALSLTLSGDILFGLAIIWRVLTLDGSAKTLGLFLCLITIVTFALQKSSIGFRRMLEKTPSRSFMWIRVIGVSFSIIFLPLLWHETIWLLYLAGMVATMINFLSTITLEAMMAQEVLEKRISSNKASRILQIATLSSSFLGAALLGLILGLGNMVAVLLFCIVTYLIGAMFFRMQSDVNKQSISTSQNKKNAFYQKMTQKTNLPVLRLAFIGLTLLMTQISAFNFLVPLIAQHEKMWSASQYGFIDAAAEFGGFLATFIMLEKGTFSKIWILAFLGILLVDILFFAITDIYLISTATLFLGFLVSCFRIKQREFIYDAVSNTDEILEWTGRITAMTAIIKALAPLGLAFFVSKPSFDLMVIGIGVSAGMLIVETILYFYTNKNLKQQTPNYSVAV